MKTSNSKNLFGIITFSILVLNVFVYLWFITHGTFDFFKEESRGSAFDSLGKSFLKMNCNVDLNAINIEAFVIGDKAYTYFAPFCALLRIVLNFLLPSFYGNWSRISCLLAALLCLFAFLLIIRKQILENTAISLSMKRFIFNISLLAFGFGSPMLFLVSSSFIYHEAQLWGFSWSLLGIYFLLSILSNKEKQVFNIFLFSICSAMAFLSKVTFGLPLFIILFFMLLNLFPNYKSKSVFTFLFVLILPILISLVFSLWYNNCRFGSFTKFIDYNYYYGYSLDPSLKEIHQATGQFNIKRIPYALANYFLLFGSEFLSWKAPYINLPDFVYSLPGLYTYKERPFPLIIVSPWILICVFFGVVLLKKTKNKIFLKLCAFGFFTQIILILSYVCINHRYAIEFFPFFVFLYSFFLSRLGEDFKFKTNENKIVSFAVLIVVFSVITTMLSTLGWSIDRISSGVPQEYVYMMESYFNKIDSFFGAL